VAWRLGLLISFFGLWEFLAKSHIVDPMLTSYLSALWPTFVSLLKGNLQQASILTHA
jgi:NitT/TauT family transport system permease protein